jgi:hypothetical protein
MEADDLTRRAVLKLGAAATVAAAVGAGAAAQAPPAGRFFTPAELALVDELSELIVPADDHSPGARAAAVAAYIDARLAEAFDAEERTVWRSGLAVVDRLAREATGQSFMDSPPDARLAVLTRMARNEGKPQAPEELFFRELKARVVHAYYTSEIGIRQEMEYKGNTYQAEFAGVDVS